MKKRSESPSANPQLTHCIRAGLLVLLRRLLEELFARGRVGGRRRRGRGRHDRPVHLPRNQVPLGVFPELPGQATCRQAVHLRGRAQPPVTTVRAARAS